MAVFLSFATSNGQPTTVQNHSSPTPPPLFRPPFQLIFNNTAMDVSKSAKVVTGDGGYVLEDVPHFTDYIKDLSVYTSLDLHFFL